MRLTFAHRDVMSGTVGSLGHGTLSSGAAGEKKMERVSKKKRAIMTSTDLLTMQSAQTLNAQLKDNEKQFAEFDQKKVYGIRIAGSAF